MKVDLRKSILLALVTVPLFGQAFGPPTQGPGPLPAGVRPPALEGVGIEEHLGRPIDLNLTFIAENGYPVALKEYFHKGRPVLLNLVYYSCPMLCNLILNGETAALREIPWTPGDQYEVVTISIDPMESFDMARKKKEVYLGSFNRPAPGWHFLVDNDGNAKRLAEQVGFKYRYDKRQEQFAHPAAIMLLTPEGKMARYLYGVRYPPRDLRFAMAEAAESRTTMAIEKILLFCYQYDPQANSYVLFATNFMRLGGALTVLCIALFLLKMFRFERRRAAQLRAEMGLKEGMA